MTLMPDLFAPFSRGRSALNALVDNLRPRHIAVNEADMTHRVPDQLNPRTNSPSGSDLL